jgi:hypothetical protein
LREFIASAVHKRAGCWEGRLLEDPAPLASEPVRAVYLTQCECSALCRLFFITPRRVGSERQNYTCSIGCILTGVIRRLHIHLFAISLSNHEMRVVQFMILFFSIEN